MIDLILLISTYLGFGSLVLKLGADRKQAVEDLKSVKASVIREINLSLLTPEEREKLNIPAPVITVDRSEAPGGKEPWEIPECYDHDWSAMWLDNPRRPDNRQYSTDGDGMVYVRRCITCGRRNVKGPLLISGKDFQWKLD